MAREPAVTEALFIEASVGPNKTKLTGALPGPKACSSTVRLNAWLGRTRQADQCPAYPLLGGQDDSPYHLPFNPSRQAITSSSPRTASSTAMTGRASNTKEGSIEQNL